MPAPFSALYARAGLRARGSLASLAKQVVTVKLLLPVTMLVFAAGFCCCGGDTVSQIEQMSSGGAPASDAAPVADAGGGAAAAGTVFSASPALRARNLGKPANNSASISLA